MDAPAQYVCVGHSVVSDSLRPRGPLARQAPLSMEFTRKEYCSGLPFPSPEDLPNPGIELGSQQLLLQLLLSLLSCSSQPPLGKKRTLSKLRSYTKEVPL